MKKKCSTVLPHVVFCPHSHRMDGRSETFRQGERLVPQRTCGIYLQQTSAAEEPEGRATREKCQAARLLQKITLPCLDLYSLPGIGKPSFPNVPQKKHLCKECNTAL